MKRLSAIFGLLFIAVSVFSQSAGDFETEIINGTVSITGYTGSKKAVRIPAKIHDMAVVSIGEFAFAEKQLTGVYIPNNELISVTIPKNIKEIGMFAFYNNQIASVRLPKDIASVGEYAFSEDKNSCELMFF
jgi:hypothetical protein